MRNEGGVHTGRFARDAAIAGERECEAASGGGASDGCDEGLRRAANGDRKIAHPALRFIDRGGGAAERLGTAAILFFEIEAGAERATCAAHDDDAGFMIVAQGREEVLEFLDHLRTERVEVVRTI